MYSEDDFLQLSGIQHFAFCRRQWALIHIEGQWEENFRTADGRIMHENAHDAEFREKRGNVITVRGMRVMSRQFGVSGECDVVEFTRDEANGVYIPKLDGKFRATPVEYKRGKPKIDDCDRVQLCALKKCCAAISARVTFFTENRAAVSELFSMMSSDVQRPKCFWKCAAISIEAIPRRHGELNPATRVR